MPSSDFIRMIELSATIAAECPRANIPSYGKLKDLAYNGKFPTRMVGRDRVVDRSNLPAVFAAIGLDGKRKA